MIKAIFYKDLNKGFLITGHSGYAESGNDIVCAAVSAYCQLALDLMQSFDIKTGIKTKDDGYVECIFKSGDIDSFEKIVNTFKSELLYLEKDYKQFISVNEM